MTAAPKPPGLHTTARELQTCTFERPGASKHHQNSTRRHPEREEKNEFCGGRGKNARNFGRSGGGRVLGRAVPGAPNMTHATHKHTNTHNHKSNSVWSKSVLAKVGHTTKTLTLTKVGLAKLGRQKGWPKSVCPKSVWPKSAMTELPGNEEQRKQRKQHKTNRRKTTKKDTGGRNKKVRIFTKHGLCPFRGLGV